MHTHPQTVWVKWECDLGRRWTSTKRTVVHNQATTTPIVPKRVGASYLIECTFSGCPPGHAEHVVGETTDIKEARAWFRDSSEGEAA